MNQKSHRNLKITLILAGSFTFAFLFGEMVHEFGHYFGHRFYNSPEVGVYLDPFGGSHITGTKKIPNNVLAVTSATGPLLNLFLGITTFIVLWRFRKPILLPLLIWGPVACIQEGVTFSLGLLTPGGDARWIATLGVPVSIILITGIILIIVGLLGVSLLLSLAGLETNNSFFQKILIVLVGMGSLMLIRAIYSFSVSPAARIENTIPLIFSLILTFLVVLLHRYTANWFSRFGIEFNSSTLKFAPLISIFLGAFIFVF
jgi:hypothetical protein